MSLELSDRRLLDAAEGWLGLGDWESAHDELEQIKSEAQGHPDVMRARWAVCAEARKWEGAVEIARGFSERFPESSFGWVQAAYALHELKRTSEAREILLGVADRFQSEWNVSYNLACYACQLGDQKEALERLKRAFELNPKARLLALEDKDLEPLRERIGEI